MQTLHTVLKRGGLFLDRELFPAALYAARLRAVQDAVAAAGDDAWLVYGDAQRYGDVAWVSHFVPRTRSALVLVPRSGPPALLASVGLRDIPNAKTLTWVDDVLPYTRLPVSAVKLINDRSLAQARLGLVGTRAALPIAEWAAIDRDLPGVRWTDRDAAFAALRAQRDDAERAGVRNAAAVVRAGLALAPALLRPGTTVRQAAAELEREMRRRAAEDVRLLVASGPQGALRPPDDRRLDTGDAVALFAAAEVQRHWAEAAQTYAIGVAPEALRALGAQAVEALGAMRAAAVPDATGEAIAAAARTALADEELFASAVPYGFGYGIGLDAEEAPAIRPGSGERVAATQALALHVVIRGGKALAAAGGTFFVDDAEPSGIVGVIECAHLPSGARG